MSDAALGRRVLHEHRRLLVPLAIALVVNLAAYVFMVRPLEDRGSLGSYAPMPFAGCGRRIGSGS